MNATVSATRFRLVAFWVAVLARALGAGCVITYGIVRSSNGVFEQTPAFLFLWLGMAAVPAFALAPLIGALASSKSRGTTMLLSTLMGLAVIGWSSVEDYQFGNAFWIGCSAVLAFESAFFSACRFAILPEAARAAHWSLPRVIGLFTAAIIFGLGMGLHVGRELAHDGRPGLVFPLRLGIIGYGLAFLILSLVRFPVAKPVRINDGLVMPMLRTGREIIRARDGRNSLFALVIIFAIGLMVDQLLITSDSRPFFYLTMLFGVLIGSLNPNAWRALGMIPFAAIGMAICAISSASSGNWNPTTFGVSGFIGLAIPGLLTAYTVHQPDDKRGHGAAILHAGWSFVTACFLAIMLLFVTDPPAARPVVSNITIGLSVALALVTIAAFYQAAFELTMEFFFTIMYRVKEKGPGVPLLPWKGPALIIANHAAWFDPLWLDKIMPAPVTPMMTSRFYDLPVIGWVCRRIVGAIRVPDATVRKEAPEINLAIAALQRGQCVAIFPEGWLRRKEEQLIRRFGRGIWQILQAAPNTPVFPCWIEGGWGSMVSHKGSPPLKNKRIDLRRRIDIGVLEPIVVPPDVLKTHMSTRIFLMKKVLEARGLLGLPAHDPSAIASHEEEPEEKRESP